jgi:putative SOS response-associated peptidase YedK
MCNLYSITKGPQAIRDFARAMRDTTGNLPPIPGVFPDYSAPIVRNAPDGVRELTVASWACRRRIPRSMAAEATLA